VGLSAPILDQGVRTMAQPADLRFASLGDISQKLKALNPVSHAHQVPVKYRLRARKYSPMVHNAAAEYHLPPEMIYAMIETESSFNPSARSGSKAVGLMQLTPKGGAQVAYRLVDDLETLPTIEQLQDPRTSIHLGAAYMRVLLDDYFDDIEDDEVRMAVALAAYNWGPTKMRAVLRAEGIPDSVEKLQKILRKHSAPAQTRDYVRMITERMDRYS
jgi:membrane-bound lytic murein transglycosylase C